MEIYTYTQKKHEQNSVSHFVSLCQHHVCLQLMIQPVHNIKQKVTYNINYNRKETCDTAQ